MIRIFMIGYSPNKGGVETYITNLTGQLEKTKFEVIYSLPEMKIDGKNWKPPHNRHNIIRYFFFWKKFFRENRFDVVYLNTCDIVSIDALKFAKNAGIPMRIIHSHSTGIQQGIGHRMCLFHRISEYYNRKVLDAYATHLLACSIEAGEWMFGNRPCLVIKNGINIEDYKYNQYYCSKIRQEYDLKGDKVIGIVGRISSAKNPLFAVKVLEKVLRDFSGISAVFVGDGELRTETEESVQTVGLQNRIIFVGAVDNVNEWLSAIDVLFLPSLFEGLPFVLVEAQAAGLPCVVSSGVSREADITGLLRFVDLNDSMEAWEEALVNALEMEREETAQQLIDAGYSVKESSRAVSDMIEEAIDNR